MNFHSLNYILLPTTSSQISPLPKNSLEALRDHNWKSAMLDEFTALISNGTWELVPRPPNVNVIQSMWIFRHKHNSDGSFERHKARLVGDDKTQQQGIDCDETFSPVVKPATIRTVPMGFRDKQYPDHACLRYIQGTLSYDLHLYKSTLGSLISYTDVDWGGCPDTRRSTSGYCVFLGDNLLSWSSKRQPTLSRSSAEAEYRGVANAMSDTCWLRNLLHELHDPITHATLVYCDNVSAIYLSNNPVQHQRTKHIEMDIHFVREKVAKGEVRVLHVPSRYQIADIFTKGLPRVLFDDFRSSLSVREPPDTTAGVC